MSSLLRTFSLKITSGFEKISDTARKILDFLDQNNLGEEFKMHTEICIVEALNNIVEHAYKEEKGKPIEINVALNDDFLTIEMVDRGIPRTEFKKAELNFDPEDIFSLPEGGMGLYIIEKIMDETKYLSKDGKNVYSMKKKLPKRSV